MDRDSLALLLAQGVSVEEIGRRFNRHPSTIGYWMAKFGLEAPNREKYAAKGGIERERLEELVLEGGMTRQIAAELRSLRSRSGAGSPSVGCGRGRRRGARRRAWRGTRASTRSTACACTMAITEFVIDYSGCYRCRKLPRRSRDATAPAGEGDPCEGGRRTVRSAGTTGISVRSSFIMSIAPEGVGGRGLWNDVVT